MNKRSKTYPLSQSQLGVVTECVMNPGTTIYHVPIITQLSKAIEIDRLVSAIHTVLET